MTATDRRDLTICAALDRPKVNWKQIADRHGVSLQHVERLADELARLDQEAKRR